MVLEIYVLILFVVMLILDVAIMTEEVWALHLIHRAPVVYLIWLRVWCPPPLAPLRVLATLGTQYLRYKIAQKMD